MKLKIKAIILALLVLCAAAVFAGCKDESMLLNYTSDTYELGTEDPLGNNWQPQD